jgi:hypothetical protein
MDEGAVTVPGCLAKEDADCCPVVDRLGIDLLDVGGRGPY